MSSPKRLLLPRTASSTTFKAVSDTFKTETRLLGAVERHMLARPPDKRDKNVLHPSEICKTDWCHRQSFYSLTGAPAETSEPTKNFVLENIFAEGHDIGRKWQDRWWGMGVLRGTWHCHSCGHRWAATSPEKCPSCAGPRAAIEYTEVPLYNEEYKIGGHADGDIDDSAEAEEDQPLIEIKSVGIGTVRFEAPELLAKHTHPANVNGHEKDLIDYNGLWKDIKRPFSVHLRQGCLYCFLAGRKKIVFIYECKWHQQAKEFVVRYQPSFIKRVLEDCKDVLYYVEKNKPPPRPTWATKTHKTCSACPYRATCYQTRNADGDTQAPGAANPGRRVVRRSEVGKKPPAQGRAEAPRRARGWPTQAPEGTD